MWWGIEMFTLPEWCRRGRGILTLRCSPPLSSVVGCTHVPVCTSQIMVCKELQSIYYEHCCYWLVQFWRQHRHWLGNCWSKNLKINHSDYHLFSGIFLNGRVFRTALVRSLMTLVCCFTSGKCSSAVVILTSTLGKSSLMASISFMLLIILTTYQY